MKTILDLTEAQSRTAVENISRTQVLKDIEEFLFSKYEGVARVSATEFAFPVALAKDEDGFTVDVAALISVKIPKFYDVPHPDSDKPTTKRYEILNQAYLWETDIKSTKKLKKEAEWLKIADEHRVEAEPIEYDFDEIDPDSFE